MSRCEWSERTDQWFDGELSGVAAEDAARHVKTCAPCQTRLTELETVRAGVQAIRKRVEINDTQMNAFMAGVREQMHAPQKSHRRLWAYLSLTAAALIAALSTFALIENGLETVDATVVESYSTELEGATIQTYDSDAGVTTVWITVSKDDVW